MVTIYNTDLFKELRDGAKIQQLTDPIPTRLADTVVPVMEVNPKLLRRVTIIKNVVTSVTGAMGTLYTTSADKDFFLTGIQCGFVKDATCDAATGSWTITCTPVDDTSGKGLISIPIVTLNAQSLVCNREFIVPIKLAKSSSISGTATYTAGLMSRTICITGYEVDNPKA